MTTTKKKPTRAVRDDSGDMRETRQAPKRAGSTNAKPENAARYSTRTGKK